MNEQQYKSVIERNEKKKFRYELYIETYQNIVDLCNTVLIRIDQLLVTNERVIEYNRIKTMIGRYESEFRRTNVLPIGLQIYGDKLKVVDNVIVIDKNYKTELQNYVMSIDQIKSLKDNCFKLLKEIEEAKKLIAKGKHSISEIAEMLNFNNSYYFSKTFKKHEKISPSEYKKKCQKPLN